MKIIPEVIEWEVGDYVKVGPHVGYYASGLQPDAEGVIAKVKGAAGEREYWIQLVGDKRCFWPEFREITLAERPKPEIVWPKVGDYIRVTGRHVTTGRHGVWEGEVVDQITSGEGFKLALDVGQTVHRSTEWFSDSIRYGATWEKIPRPVPNVGDWVSVTCRKADVTVRTVPDVGEVVLQCNSSDDGNFAYRTPYGAKHYTCASCKWEIIEKPVVLTTLTVEVTNEELEALAERPFATGGKHPRSAAFNKLIDQAKEAIK